ncbi:sulfotransferase 1B1-like [Ornithodoros turicata]|uniref:sulfotransferase 1B1-like n=1 Tax=Ornithodoros turicata TaxID=34597 RepID=UPI00313A0927
MISLKFLYSNPLGALLTGSKCHSTSSSSSSTGGNGTSTTSGNSDEWAVVPADQDPAVVRDPQWQRYALSIPRAQSFRGVLLQGYLVHPHVLRGLHDFKIRADDVFVITYPKSGTTWMEEIVSLIYNGGDPERVKNKLLAYRVQHLEVGPPVGHLWHLRKTRAPRLLATHLPLRLIPKQLQQAKCKVIYVIRNPKDNAVSYYHHHKISTFLGNYKGSWDEFLAHYMDGHVVYGSWFEHVLPYWQFYLEHPDRVMVVSFEELKIDLSGMVRRISQFLGKPLGADAIAAVANHCSFDQMKNNNMVNREVLPITDLFDMSQSKFMRKGIIGDWKNYFTPEQSKAFDELYAERMADSGLDLVFEPQDALERMRKLGRIIVTPDPRVSWGSSDPDTPDEEGSTQSCPCFFDSPTLTRRDVPLHHSFLTPDPLSLTG